MIKVLVTGSMGQLGKALQKIANDFSKIQFEFKDSNQLDITELKSLRTTFKKNEGFDYCINCAAYTQVDQAEESPKEAFNVNAEGARNVAEICKEFDTVMIHISTDYVFDGKKKAPYTVNDIPNPINEYGRSKLQGERYIQQILGSYVIIRTSWLYSEFGNNFYRTILEKAKKEAVIYVTDKQMGCPTNANHLARHLLEIIVSEKKEFGIFHFTDGIPMSWYDFAKSILERNQLSGSTRIVKDDKYRTFAPRPKYSVLE